MMNVIRADIFRAVHYGMGILAAIPFGGFSDGTDGFWLNFLQAFAIQSYKVAAACMLGLLLVFFMKNSYAVIEVHALIFALPGFALSMLPSLFENMDIDAMMRFFYFDVTTNVIRLNEIAEMETRSILLVLLTGSLWFFIPTIIGLVKFRKREIK